MPPDTDQLRQKLEQADATIELVREMRKAQKSFFRRDGKYSMEDAKELEREVDRRLARPSPQRTLFDSPSQTQGKP